MTRPYPPTQENLGEKSMAEPTKKPSVERAIEWGHNVKDSAFLRSWNQDHFQILIEAAEQSAEKDRRIEELREQRRIQDDIQATHEKEEQRLRSQLAETERYARKLDGDIIELVKTFGEKPAPAPTQAEVDKVAVRIAREMDRADRLTLSQSREVARHVIERGYRMKECPTETR